MPEPVNCRNAAAAAFRRSRGQRDDRVRGAVPAARRAGLRQIVDRAFEKGDGLLRRCSRRADRERAARRADLDRATRSWRRRRRSRTSGASVTRVRPVRRALTVLIARSASRRTIGAPSASPCRRTAAANSVDPMRGPDAARIASRRTCTSGSAAARRSTASSTASASINAVIARRRTRASLAGSAALPAGCPGARAASSTLLRTPETDASAWRAAIRSASGGLSLRCSRTTASRPRATPSRSAAVWLLAISPSSVCSAFAT